MHADDQGHLDTCLAARGLLETRLRRSLTVVEHSTLAVLSRFTSAGDWEAAACRTHPRSFDALLDAAVATAVARSLPRLLGCGAAEGGGIP